MKIKCDLLRKFKSATSHIKPSGLLPILEYVRIKDGTITKTNLHNFCTMEVGGTGEVIIEERILWAIVDRTTKDEIDIVVKDGRAILSDGDNTLKSATVDSIDFPKNDEMPDDGQVVPDGVLHAIRNAAGISVEADNLSVTNYVFVSNKAVCASDGFLCYMSPVESEMPPMALRREVAVVVAKMKSPVFSEIEKYHFFLADGITYGFVKSEMNYRDLSGLFTADKEAGFVAETAQIEAFNDICMAASPQKVMVANWAASDNVLKLWMNDSDYEIDTEKIVPVTGSGREFSYNPILLNRLLKNIPDDTLTFHPSVNKYYITSDSGTIALIMEIQKQ